MKYEVEYSAPSKLDKWGHFLPDQPPLHRKGFDTLAEAKAFALETSAKFRKYDVHVYDLNVYDEEEEMTGTWCILSYHRGKCIFQNRLYF